MEENKELKITFKEIESEKEKEQNKSAVIAYIPGRLMFATDEEGRDIYDERRSFLRIPACLCLIQTHDLEHKMLLIRENGDALVTSEGKYFCESGFYSFKTNNGARFVFEEDGVESESALIGLMNYKENMRLQMEHKKHIEEIRGNAALHHILKGLGLV